MNGLPGWVNPFVKPEPQTSLPCKVELFTEKDGREDWRYCGKPAPIEGQTALEVPVCDECWSVIR